MRAPFQGLLVLLLMLTVSTSLLAQEYECQHSDTYPVSVCNEVGHGEHLVATTLHLAELAWQMFPEQGFPEPLRSIDEETIEPGVTFFISNLGWGGLGIAMPGVDVPETAHSDCSAVLILDSANTVPYLPLLVGHYFGQAMIYADDCVEQPKMFAGYYEYLFVRESEAMPWNSYLNISQYYFQSFQQNPHLALSFFRPNDSELYLYHYGHPLFAMYLDQRWGENDGRLIAEIGAASRQDGNIVIRHYSAVLAEGENEPDFYDGIESVLSNRGAGFWDAVKEFSVWRLMTGELDDDQHLEWANYLPEVEIEMSFALSSLPILGVRPTNSPQETGTSYTLISLAGDTISSPDDALLVRVASPSSSNWYLAAVAFSNSGQNHMVDTETDNGEAILAINQLDQRDFLVVAVTNLGDLDHDPDNRQYRSDLYTLDVELLFAPFVDAVSPTQVELGSQDLPLSITGRNLDSMMNLHLGEGVEVTPITVDPSGTSLSTTLTVSHTAELGPRTLRLGYDLGPLLELSEAIEIIASSDPLITSITPDTIRAGQNLNIQVNGDFFDPGATVSFDNTQLTVVRTEVASRQLIFVQLSAATDALSQSSTITVTNSDSRSGSLANALLIDGLSDEGCGCISAQSSTAARSSFLLLLAALSLFAAARRQPSLRVAKLRIRSPRSSERLPTDDTPFTGAQG